MNYRKQFKIDCPETVGEKDNAFDNSNYIDWLEKTLDNTLKQVKNINYDAVLATVLDDPNTVRLCKPNYLAKDGSIQPAKRFDDYKNGQHIYYCHKNDLYGG